MTLADLTLGNLTSSDLDESYHQINPLLLVIHEKIERERERESPYMYVAITHLH
jgi:hypothetical protein